MSAILLPKIQKLIQEEKERIIQEQVTNWLMRFAAKSKLEIQYFNGKKIGHGGVVGFEGSPQHVFWGRYIEPYLEDITERLIKEISHDCTENNLNLAEELQSLQEHLNSLYFRVYEEMVKVEQKLLGKGYPELVPKRDVSGKVECMKNYLEQHVNMEIAKSRSRLENGEIFMAKTPTIKDLKATTPQNWKGIFALADEDDLHAIVAYDRVRAKAIIRERADSELRKREKEIKSSQHNFSADTINIGNYVSGDGNSNITSSITTNDTNKSKKSFLKKIWSDPVWSNVIAAVIISLLAGLLAYTGLTA